MKKILASIALALSLGLTATSSSADVWLSRNGILMSNVCVAPTGHYMIFRDDFGAVGSPCYFRFYGVPGTFYGTWQ